MEISIPSGSISLNGNLSIPIDPAGVIIFVHGSGSSRKSVRNKFVAKKLNQSGFATLLFDLLSSDEEVERENVFDIELLSQRLIEVTKWVSAKKELSKLAIGYFGASTGAAAALVSAAYFGESVSAVVSRGGRVDLAGNQLSVVESPTLLIVGENDFEVLDLNISSQEKLKCVNELRIVPGATHLFEETGALEMVAYEAGEWFSKYLRAS